MMELLMIFAAGELAAKLVEKGRARMTARVSVDVGVVEPGQPVGGLVTIEARRQLDAARITASLVCRERTIVKWNPAGRDDDLGMTHSFDDEIFRYDTTLFGPGSLEPGHRISLPFTVLTPDPETRRATDGICSYWLERDRTIDEGILSKRIQSWTLEIHCESNRRPVTMKHKLDLAYDLDNRSLNRVESARS